MSPDQAHGVSEGESAAEELVVLYETIPCLHEAARLLSEHRVDREQTQLWVREFKELLLLGRVGMLPRWGQWPARWRSGGCRGTGCPAGLL